MADAVGAIVSTLDGENRHARYADKPDTPRGKQYLAFEAARAENWGYALDDVVDELAEQDDTWSIAQPREWSRTFTHAVLDGVDVETEVADRLATAGYPAEE